MADEVIAYARVTYSVPVYFSDLEDWDCSTPADEEDDAWIFESEKRVEERLPDLLERSGPPEVEVW